MPGNGTIDGPSWLNVLWAIAVFAVIIIGAYYAARLLGKRSFGLARGEYIEIIDRAMLSNDKWLCIVKIGEKYFLLSVTASSINLISEFTQDALDFSKKEKKEESDTVFAKYMRLFIKNMGNRSDETDKR